MLKRCLSPINSPRCTSPPSLPIRTMRPRMSFAPPFAHASANTMRGTWTIVLLVLSNVFMTLAWYGHLRFKDHPSLAKLGLFAVILTSWGIAFFEY